MRFIKYLINLIFLLLVIMFFIENSEPLSQKIQFHFNFFLTERTFDLPELPLYFFLLAFFAAGALLTLFYLLWGRWLLGCSLRRANSKIRKLEKEIQDYRCLPVTQRASNAGNAEQNQLKPAEAHDVPVGTL
jgi:uncharacterized membrane protein YciS (DUF1049 family)